MMQAQIHKSERTRDQEQDQRVPKRGEGASQATLAVKTVIPHPTTQLIDDSEVEEYDEALKAQLKALSEYTNPKAHIYAFGKLLPTATWGPYKPINDRSKILCDPATGEPLTIWVVGHIAKMWFMKQGNPESQASITVMPLSQTLGKQSSLLLTKFSNPVLNEFKSTDHKYDPGDEMAENKGGDRSIRFLFDAVYDTRKAGSLKTYSERPMWKLTDLKPGDLILLEMKMTWYSRKGEDNKWQSRAQYEMLAISLLHMVEMPEDDQDVWKAAQRGIWKAFDQAESRLKMITITILSAFDPHVKIALGQPVPYNNALW
ncbi:hypothetical protein P692DRAFT_201811669 [Suillus brevipes Sb2]|nr:hypothetical protein P692DRAFT_201811669 [Suillus brevipes Sb2]